MVRTKWELMVYETDFYGWALHQAALLRERRFSELDLGNLVDEVGSLGRQEAAELEELYELLIQRLLLWEFKPSFRSVRLEVLIGRDRRLIAEHLADNQSLRPLCSEIYAEAYPNGRDGAVIETDCPPEDFPSENPYTLGRVDEPEPEAGGDEMDEGEEALGRLVVPCGHGPELLQLVDEPLDPVAEPVQRAVERGGLLAHRVRGDDRQDPSHQQLPPDPVGVVARVADQAADARRHVLEQGPERAGLVRLPGREDDGQGQAAGVAAEVQLGREPAARSAQGLTVPPPFAPAACWWARIVVPSSICSRSSAAPLPARAWNTASNTPRSRQRAKRRQTVFRLPYRSGMVRQRAPSRARHRMPSRRRRFSRPGRPRSVDSSGPTSPHSASVRSPEATPSSRYRKGGRTLDTPVPVPFVHTA
jgi:hypothetical protein